MLFRSLTGAGSTFEMVWQAGLVVTERLRHTCNCCPAERTCGFLASSQADRGWAGHRSDCAINCKVAIDITAALARTSFGSCYWTAESRPPQSLDTTIGQLHSLVHGLLLNLAAPAACWARPRVFAKQCALRIFACPCWKPSQFPHHDALGDNPHVTCRTMLFTQVRRCLRPPRGRPVCRLCGTGQL